MRNILEKRFFICLKISQLCLLSLALVSCGPDKKNLKRDLDRQENHLALILSAGSCEPGENAWTAQERQLQRLFSQLDPVDLSNNDHWTPANEINVDAEVLIEKSESLMARTKSVSPLLIPQILRGQSGVFVLNEDQKAKLARLKLDFEIFLAEKSRFLARECELEKLAERNVSLRFFLQWRKEFCPGGNCADDFKGREGLVRYERLCKQLYKPVQCAVFMQMGRQNQIPGGLDNKIFQTWNQKIQQQFFTLKNKNLYLQCLKVAGKNRIEVPVFISDMVRERWPGKFQEYLSQASAYWKNEEIQVIFREALIGEQNPVMLKLSDKVLSYVPQLGGNELYLSRFLSHDERLVKILAHELGHVIGLPDCYVEGVSLEDNRFFYFELDRKNKNLMCSIDFGSKISESAFIQIKTNYCQ